jgi:hypothetical protein
MRSVVLLSCLCVAPSAVAADFYSLSVSRDGDAHLAAPPSAVYAVLTDYEHLTRISSAVQKSRVVDKLADGAVLVYTDTHACVLFFCKHILETQRYTHPDPEDIVSEVVPEQSNLKSGRTVWHVEAEQDGTRLHWEMTAVPDFWVPPFIGPSLVQRGLRSQGTRSVEGIEKLARERSHLPPLGDQPADAAQKTSPNR